MSSTFARSRGKEAPMTGVEFTNRPSPIPAWRLDSNQTTPMKRTFSNANPPPSPFQPAQNIDSKPVLGSGVHYLFNPPAIPGSSSWASLNRTPEAPEVDMADPQFSPSPVQSKAKESKGKENEPIKPEAIARRSKDEEEDARQISNSAVIRVLRARKKAKGRLRKVIYADEVGESDEDSDEDNDEQPMMRHLQPMTQNTNNHYTLNMPSPAAPKSDTPYILLGYVQFLFNLSLVLVFLYLLLQFIITVQRDVQERVREYSMAIIQDISTCKTLYTTNLCDTTPIPAMTHQCSVWEACMLRDPSIVGRTRVMAEMMAEVINGFVEPISWKTLGFSILTLTSVTVSVNMLLSLFRSKHNPAAHPHLAPQQQPMHLPPPHLSPYPYAYLPPNTPMRWPSWHPEDSSDQVPSQRRRLEHEEKSS